MNRHASFKSVKVFIASALGSASTRRRTAQLNFGICAIDVTGGLRRTSCTQLTDSRLGNRKIYVKRRLVGPLTLAVLDSVYRRE